MGRREWTWRRTARHAEKAGVTGDRTRIMRRDLCILTSQVDHDLLRAMFGAAAPDLTLHIAGGPEDIAPVLARLDRPVRLVSILSGRILPADFLADLGEPAYNIHPGPPNYPGSCPEVFALYEGAELYGVTAHVMAPQVDAGPIVAVDRFPIPPNCDRVTLGRLAWQASLALLSRLAPRLATERDPLPPIVENWSGIRRSGRAFAQLAEMNSDIDPQELERRIRSLDDGSGLLTLRHHDRIFRLVP
jgi:methionyl-tRNA formyltransferase